MKLRISNAELRMAGRHAPRGFSFTEILFAVMILGIGFIMVAAMFPVAIHQTEDTTRETIAASIARQAYSFANQLANIQVITNPATPVAQQRSILLPTAAPGATVSASNPYGTATIPPGQTSYVVPGPVWSCNRDSRDVATYATLVTLANVTPSVLVRHAPYLQSWVANSMIQGSDTRFAWVPFYRRDLVAQGAPQTVQQLVPAPYAQVIFVATEARVKPAYDSTDTLQSGTSPFAASLIAGVQVSNLSAAGNATITFPSGAANVGAGAFVIISADGQTGSYNTPTATGSDNGRIYRLGTSVGNSTTTYYFAPGEGPGPTDAALSNATVFVVGAAKDAATGAYTGGAQDVSVYTTYVQTP